MKRIFTIALVMLFAFSMSAQRSVISAKKSKALTTVEKTTLASIYTPVNSQKAQWDVLFEFGGVEAASPGIETNGTYFYTTTWNAGNFHRYDMDGGNAETFTISGISAIRDMAYCEATGYFYGSPATMTIYIMDLDNEASMGTITVDGATGITGVRHIAYDPTLDGGNGGFWVGNWSELAAIDMSGNSLVANSATPDMNSAYGSAFDNWTDPSNPKLWIATQPGTPSDAVFEEFDINTLALTGVTRNVISDLTGADATALSGGACTYEADGLFILAGSLQQDPNLIFGYELTVTADAAAPAAPADFVATPAADGAFTVDLAWTNPDLQVDGGALTELTMVEVFVDDDMYATYTATYTTTAGIGANETYTATVAMGGMHTFKVVGTNAAGTGIPVAQTVFVGVDVEVAGFMFPDYLVVDETFSPTVTVTNNGVGAQTFDLTLTDGAAYTEVVTVTALASGASTDVVFPGWSSSIGGTYSFTATAADPGSDIDLSNNEAMTNIAVFDGCAHTLELYDDWGDGWNGNAATVSVNGVVVLDNVTIATGDYAEFTFFANDGDEIIFEFDGAGSYVYECSWIMYDGLGQELLNGGLGDDPVTETVYGLCTMPDYDAVFEMTFESEYTMYPVNQAPVDGFVMSGEVTNGGLNELTNVMLTVTADDGSKAVVWTGTSDAITLPFGDSETLTTTENFIPASNGSFTLAYEVTLDQADEFPLNNSAEGLIAVDTTYARDNGVVDGTLGIGDGIGGSLGLVYELVAADILTSVSFQLGADGVAPTVGLELEVEIFEFSDGSGPGDLLYTSETFTIPSDVAAMYTVDIDDMFLPAGKYLVALHEHTDNITLATSSENYTPGTNWVTFTDVAWTPGEDLGFGVNYILRPNFGAELNNIVTMEVDMTPAIDAGTFTPSTDVVYLTGSMTGWAEPGQSGSIAMTEGANNVYSTDLNLEDGDYEYKYFVNAGWDGGEWNGGDNRVFTVAGEDMTVHVVWRDIVSIEGIDAEVSISPNPTNGLVKVVAEGTYTVDVLDMSGRLVYKTEMNNVANIDISNESVGIYIVRLSNENGTATYKVIKK